jgi:septation ring formation regulator EzrA
LVERKKLPGEIAKLSSEGKRLVETMADLKESARRLVERRLQEMGERLARLETRLSEVERETSSLDAVEVEAGWVGQVLDDFTSVWDVLTPENRGRLLRAVVQTVEVDEPANQVKVVMADLEAGISSAGEPTLQEATA